MSARRSPVRSGWAGRPARWVGTVAPALVVVPAAFAPDEVAGPPVTDVADVAVLVAAALAVMLRLRFPLVAAAAAIAVAVAGVLTEGPIVAVSLALVVVVFSVARHRDRRTAVAVALAAGTVVGGSAAVLVPPPQGGLGTLVQVVAWVGFAAAAGDASRSRRAAMEAVTERARRAEETKESEARRRVAEERLTIARDLHDVLAHQIAVVNLHANVASQALRTRPDDAERSLLAIRDANRTVLAEIGNLVRVLRATDLGSPAASDTAPVPGLDDLDTLVADFVRSGLQVEVRTVGEPVAVPPAVGVAAYRIVQEGLTNAHKHSADAAALLQVEYEPETLEITVVNTVNTVNTGADRAGRGGRPVAGGHGLIGARERAAAVRGELETAVGPGPVHRLTARLPVASDGAGPAAPALGQSVRGQSVRG